MYKKILSSLLTVFVLCLCLALDAFAAEYDISARAAVVYNPSAHEVIFERSGAERLPMASTTKIMTSILLIENSQLTETLTVTDEMIRVEGSSMGLSAGDTVSVEALVCGMLLESGNDAANAAAYAVSGGVKEFAELMNKKARELGMMNTKFSNPSGLPDDDHYSSAYDMALLAAYALNNSVFRRFCSMRSASVTFGNPASVHVMTNHNRLLNSYNGAIGVKTGFTKASGRCLVSAAQRNGTTLIAVTLNAPDDWRDHNILLDSGFEKIKKYSLECDLTQLSMPVIGGESAGVGLKVETVPECSAAGGKPEYVCMVYYNHFDYAPLFSGKVVGFVRYYVSGRFFCEEPLIVDSDVSSVVTPKEPEKPGFFERILEKLNNYINNHNYLCVS